MKFLPWVLTIIFATTTLMQFSRNQKMDSELSRLPALQTELDNMRAEIEEARKTHVDQNELERLRKEGEEVYKLRNQIGLLKKQLAQRPPPMGEIARADSQPQPPDPTAVEPETPQEDPVTKQQREQCIQNMKVIEEAKTMWAVANNKNAGDKATIADITTALPNNSMPLCPAGGVYNLNEVGIPVSCSIPAHSLLP
jgi:hypothetical protein